MYRVLDALTTARIKQLNNVLDRLLAYATLIVIGCLDTIIIVLDVRLSAVFTLYIFSLCRVFFRLCVVYAYDETENH